MKAFFLLKGMQIQSYTHASHQLVVIFSKFSFVNIIVPCELVSQHLKFIKCKVWRKKIEMKSIDTINVYSFEYPWDNIMFVS